MPTKNIIGALSIPSLSELFSIDDKPNPKIKKVIYNDPATVVIWEDDSKTVVKCQQGDVYNREKGLLLCIAKKYFGNKGNFNEVLKKYIPITEDSSLGETLKANVYEYKTNYTCRIQIIDAKSGALGANGKTGYFTSRPKSNGLLDSDPGYNVECENGEVWRIAPDANIIKLKNKEGQSNEKNNP